MSLQIYFSENRQAFGCSLRPWIHYGLTQSARWFGEWRNMTGGA
jgi:hypothetical protein